MMSHSKEIEAFLNRRVSEAKHKTVLEMAKRYKLGCKKADAIYTEWRKKYVTGKINVKEKDSMVGNLKLYAKHYAKTNMKGYTEEEVLKLVNNINTNGVSGTARKLGMDRKDVYAVYANAKGFGLINLVGNCRRGKYAR